MTRRTGRSLRAECGQLFVLLAMMMVIIIGFVGLAIDNVMHTDMRYNAKAVADMVCLSAAERYLVLRQDLGTSSVPDNISLIDQTVARANQIADLNAGVALVTDRHFGNLDDHYETNSAGQAGGTGGAVFTGVYHRDQNGLGQIENPPGSGTYTNPPCGTAPCFEANDTSNASQDDQVNAVRCEMRVNDDQGIGSIFRRMINNDPVQITMTSTAALLPRHVVFAMDISGSVQRASGYLNQNVSCPAECVAALDAAGECQPPSGGNPVTLFPCYYTDLTAVGHRRIRGTASKWAMLSTPSFYTGLTGTLPYNWYDVCPSPCNPTTFDDNICWYDDMTQTRPHYDCKWNGLEGWGNTLTGTYTVGDPTLDPWQDITLTAPAGTIPLSTWKKWREDWFCDDDGSPYPGNCGSGPDTTLVADYRDCDIQGPLVGFFAFARHDDPEPLFSILQAINGGLTALRDRLVAGDAAGIIGFGTTSPPHCTSAPFIGFEPSLESRYFPLGSDINEMIDTTDITQDLYRNKAFFPIGFESTNTPAAINQALQELSQHPDAENSEASIILIYDGFSNCHDTDNDGTYETCGNGEQDYLDSAADVQDLADDLADNEIALNVVLVGDQAKPHTNLARKPNNGSGCADDDDFRYHSYSFVNPACQGPQTCGAACTTPCPDDWATQEFIGYTGVNQAAYNLAVTTGGFFAPVRPPCVAGTDITATLDTACDSQGNNWQSGGSAPSPVVVTPHTDTFGRLLCEQTGSQISAQVQVAVEEFLEESPFNLVD